MRAKTALIYGPSGIGKTNQLQRLAYWILRKVRKDNPNAHIRLISADGGGWTPFEQSGMIEDGLVQAYDISNCSDVFTDYRKLSEGWWEYGNGLEPTPDSEWKNVVGIFLEGATSMGNAFMSWMSEQDAGVGFKFAFRYEQGGQVIGGLQEGHYGLAQREFYKLMVRGFNTLPVPWVVWTALQNKALDKKSGETVIGPEHVGKAITHQIGAWVGTMLHLDKTVVKAKNKQGEIVDAEIRVAWFDDHIDPEQQLRCMAKSRALEAMYPKLKEKFKYGFVPLIAGKGGIETYFEIEEVLSKEYQENMRKDIGI